MSSKTLTPTERSFEIRHFAEDFAGCVYVGDVSSPESDGGRYAVTSKLRENVHLPTMTIPMDLCGKLKMLFDDIQNNASMADMPTIMQNLDLAESSLKAAYNLVRYDTSPLRGNEHEAVKRNLESSQGEFEQLVSQIRTLDR
jgi:hypothetical protein